MKNKFGFILVKPQLGENIGACARSMKNFGFSKLYVVNPKFSFPNHKAKATSVGAYDIINKAKNYFDENQIIINNVDKKAYLSSLKLANHIVVTCDSTSMISEAAMTGKPIYIAHMPPIKKNYRFKKFFELFLSLNITRKLEDSIEDWNYKKLNETEKISSYIKEQLKNYDFS